MLTLGSFLVWTVAGGMVAAVPAGLGLAAHAMLAPRFAYADVAARIASAFMGLALAASAAVIIAHVAPAFAEVML